jgi:hypothetical protein
MLDGARGDAEGGGHIGHLPARSRLAGIAQEQGASDDKLPRGSLVGFGESFQIETFRSGEFDFVAWWRHAPSFAAAKSLSICKYYNVT